MEINNLQKWNIARKISDNRKYECKYDSLIIPFTTIERPSTVKFVSKTIDFHANDAYTPLPHQVVIIDFESSPVTLIGLMIYDTILTYYIEDYQHLNEFYHFILKLFSIASEHDLIFFCFSSFEQQEILKIYDTLNEQQYDLSDYDFINSFPIINLQKEKYESVAEAVFSSNREVQVIGDPLFRNIRVIDKLFTTKRFQEIVIHNHNCLLNESIIFQRWMKYYDISEKKKAR